MRRKPGYFWSELDDDEWVDESAEELHALFLRWQALHRGESPAWSERDESRYTVLMAHLVAMTFRRKNWFRSLKYEGLDANDVMQTVLWELIRKTKTLVVRLQGHGYRPLLGLLLQKICWVVATELKNQKNRASRRPVLMTDYAKHGPDPLGHDLAAAPRIWANVDSPELADVVAFAHSEDTRDQVVGDIPTSTQTEAEAIDRLFDVLLDALFSQHDTIPFVLLPAGIQQEITREQHALVLSRLLRVVRNYAA